MKHKLRPRCGQGANQINSRNNLRTKSQPNRLRHFTQKYLTKVVAFKLGTPKVKKCVKHVGGGGGVSWIRNCDWACEDKQR